MGRKFSTEIKTVVSIYLPVNMVTQIDEITDNRSRFIEGVLRESMDLYARDQIEQELYSLEIEKLGIEKKIARLKRLQLEASEVDADTKELEKAIGVDM